MAEYPTMWGWITVGFAVPFVACIFWRVKVRSSSKSLRRVAVAAIILFGLPFLFSFMQWASWYE